jgi:hypothetical protein
MVFLTCVEFCTKIKEPTGFYAGGLLVLLISLAV